jgi:hypothetical protein
LREWHGQETNAVAALLDAPTVHPLADRPASGFICSTLIAQAFALIGHSMLPEAATACQDETYHNVLVPADFERASLFAIVWPVNVSNLPLARAPASARLLTGYSRQFTMIAVTSGWLQLL